MAGGEPVIRRATGRSAELFAEAQELIPGGVNSPVRAFRGVGGTPPFIVSGAGARLTDADGNDYIDYVMSWGALALGHAHPGVVAAIRDQAGRGTSYGAPTERETELSRRISEAVPSIEMLRLVSSGTEAAMSALRLARAVTRRQRVLKFIGCYHGHADALLAAAGSGVATLALPDSPGVTAGAIADTLLASFNDLDAVAAEFAADPDGIAAIIVEPVAGNMGLVLPRPGFLAGLRQISAHYGALLIFDEVMSGFRVGWGGAQELYGVRPDLTCLGKVIGGGLPMGAYGGRRDLMREIAPSGPVYQAGTLSGNPLAVSAGLATLDELARPGAYHQLADASRTLADALSTAAVRAGVPLISASVGGMWGFFFSDAAVTDFASAKRSDSGRYARFFHAMLDEGIYLAPSAFEAAFVSLAHDDATLAATIAAFERALARA